MLEETKPGLRLATPTKFAASGGATELGAIAAFTAFEGVGEHGVIAALAAFDEVGELGVIAAFAACGGFEELVVGETLGITSDDFEVLAITYYAL